MKKKRPRGDDDDDEDDDDYVDFTKKKARMLEKKMRNVSHSLCTSTVFCWSKLSFRRVKKNLFVR